MSVRKQSPLKRPKMRSLSDRNSYFEELKLHRQRQQEVTASQPQKRVIEPARKLRTRDVWADLDIAKDYCSIDSIARPLVEHGWSPDNAIRFAHQAINARRQHPDTRFCTCGAKATVASEKSGPRCVTCLLELECDVVHADEPKTRLFGQRRVGTQLGDPSPWLENAVRHSEDD